MLQQARILFKFYLNFFYFYLKISVNFLKIYKKYIYFTEVKWQEMIIHPDKSSPMDYIHHAVVEVHKWQK